MGRLDPGNREEALRDVVKVRRESSVSPSLSEGRAQCGKEVRRAMRGNAPWNVGDPRNTEPMPQAVGLSRSFGPIEVLSDVSIDVRAGEVHAIIGENGAGKSTLMKIFSGHLAPTRGALKLDGAPVELRGAGRRRAARHRAGASGDHARARSDDRREHVSRPGSAAGPRPSTTGR